MNSKKKKKNTGLIIGFFNYINAMIMRGLTTGIFAKMFTGEDKFEEKAYKGAILGQASLESSKGNRCAFKRSLLYSFDESFILNVIRRFIGLLKVCRLNVYGAFFSSFGIYSLTVFLIKYYIENQYSFDKYIWGETAFLSSLFIIIASVPLLCSAKKVYELVNESICVRPFLEETLGVVKDKFSDQEHSVGHSSYFVAIILGLLMGGVSYFISPLLILLSLLGLLFVGFVICFPEAGVLISIFCAPFLGFTEHPTIIVTLMTGITTMSYIFKVAVGKRVFRLRMLDLFVLLFAFLMFFGGVITSGGIASFKSAVTYTVLLTVYFLIVNMMNSREWLDRCVAAISLPSIFVAVYGILGYSTVIMPGGWLDSSMFSGISGRAVSMFDNPNMLATYLILTSPFLWMNVHRADYALRRRIVYATGSVLSAVCMLLTWSRGGWLGMIVGIFVYLMINYKYTLKYIFVGLILSPIWSLAIPKNVLERFFSIGNMTDSSTYYRLFTWKGSLKMLSEYFMGGIGVGESAFAQIYPIYSYVGTEITAHSHNLFLEIAIELGIIALFVFVAIMFCVARRGFRGIKCFKYKNSRILLSAGISGIAGALIHGMVDHIWYNYRIFFAFWCVTALICACSNVEKKTMNDCTVCTSDADKNEATLDIIFGEN